MNTLPQYSLTSLQQGEHVLLRMTTLLIDTNSVSPLHAPGHPMPTVTFTKYKLEKSRKRVEARQRGEN